MRMESSPDLPLSKRLRQRWPSPGAWLGYGLACWGIAVSIWTADHFGLNLPPWAIATLFTFFGMGLICLIASAREYFIRHGIGIAEQSGLLPATITHQAAQPDSVALVRDNRQREYEARIAAKRGILTQEDMKILQLLSREQKTKYTIADLVAATTLSRDRCQYHIDRLVAAEYVMYTQEFGAYGNAYTACMIMPD